MWFMQKKAQNILEQGLIRWNPLYLQDPGSYTPRFELILSPQAPLTCTDTQTTWLSHSNTFKHIKSAFILNESSQTSASGVMCVRNRSQLESKKHISECRDVKALTLVFCVFWPLVRRAALKTPDIPDLLFTSKHKRFMIYGHQNSTYASKTIIQVWKDRL